MLLYGRLLAQSLTAGAEIFETPRSRSMSDEACNEKIFLYLAVFNPETRALSIFEQAIFLLGSIASATAFLRASLVCGLLESIGSD